MGAHGGRPAAFERPCGGRAACVTHVSVRYADPLRRLGGRKTEASNVTQPSIIPGYTNLPLTDGDQSAIAGDYAFGAGPADRFRVSTNPRGDLTIARTGMVERNLFHQGGLVFNPSGAEAVKIRFDVTNGRARRLMLEDGAAVVNATRM